MTSARSFTVLLILCIGFVVLTRYVKVNAMSSLDYGLYWIITPQAPLTPGVVVLVQTPATRALMHTLHGSFVAAWPLLKPVAALPGDTVCREGDLLMIHGMSWGRFYATSTRGHLLPHWLAPGECRTLAAAEVFLASPRDGSLDSRYVGPVPMTFIRQQAIPLLTWN